MKKAYRIKEHKEFKKIMDYRRFKNSSSFTVYIKPRIQDHSRIGIAIPKKIGNAVSRNKVKRQVRQMVQQISDYSEEFDFIILIRKGYLEQNFNQNQKDLEKLMKTVKI